MLLKSGSRSKNKKIVDLKNKIDGIEVTAESRVLSPLELQDRLLWKKELNDLEEARNKDIRQKARVKWVVDGDENSGFLHGTLRSNLKNSRINDIMVDGVWQEDPNVIKKEFFEHFNA